MGTSNLGWLESRFHFSFAKYRNPSNMSFGVLRVLNDDIIHPQNGFDKHPHSNMEIISYVVKGEITHKDSRGNSETLKRGEVQYLSAGNGISHSEHNIHKSLDFNIDKNRQVYFIQIEGSSKINNVILENGDAMEITDESSINIEALLSSHFLFIEMPQS